MSYVRIVFVSPFCACVCLCVNGPSSPATTRCACVLVRVRSPTEVRRARANAGFHDGLFVGPRKPRERWFACTRVCAYVNSWPFRGRAPVRCSRRRSLLLLCVVRCSPRARVFLRARAEHGRRSGGVHHDIRRGRGRRGARPRARRGPHGARPWALVGAPIESMLTAAGDAWAEFVLVATGTCSCSSRPKGWTELRARCGRQEAGLWRAGCNTAACGSVAHGCVAAPLIGELPWRPARACVCTTWPRRA
jgi:hypothetical protein